MTDRFGRAKVATIQRDINALRAAIRDHDAEATEIAWDHVERWLGAMYPSHEQFAASKNPAL